MSIVWLLMAIAVVTLGVIVFTTLLWFVHPATKWFPTVFHVSAQIAVLAIIGLTVAGILFRAYRPTASDILGAMAIVLASLTAVFHFVAYRRGGVKRSRALLCTALLFGGSALVLIATSIMKKCPWW